MLLVFRGRNRSNIFLLLQGYESSGTYCWGATENNRDRSSHLIVCMKALFLVPTSVFELQLDTIMTTMSLFLELCFYFLAAYSAIFRRGGLLWWSCSLQEMRCFQSHHTQNMIFWGWHFEEICIGNETDNVKKLLDIKKNRFLYKETLIQKFWDNSRKFS